VLKAQGQYRSAQAAEERAKTREKNAALVMDDDEESSPEFDEAYEAYLRGSNGARGFDPGMPGVSGVVAGAPEARAEVRAQVKARRRG